MSIKKRYRKTIEYAREQGVYVHLLILEGPPENYGYLKSEADPADLTDCLDDLDAYLDERLLIPEIRADFEKRWPAVVKRRESKARIDDLVAALNKAADSK